MKKKWLWVIVILAALVLLATLIGPRIILRVIRQPESAQNYDYIESLSRKTKAKTFISYKTADGYVNAERSGNLILKIK